MRRTCALLSATASRYSCRICRPLWWRFLSECFSIGGLLFCAVVAQKLWLLGFSRGIQEMHRKASLVLEDAVRNIYTVVAFCAGNKIMDLYRFQLGHIYVV